MLIKGASWDEINAALFVANDSFEDNLRFKRCEFVGLTRDKREKYRVTLTVEDSREAGARRSYEGHRIAAACWHAHGTFFDALPEGTEIQTFAGTFHAGDPWIDYSVGSDFRPAHASELCECGL